MKLIAKGCGYIAILGLCVILFDWYWKELLTCVAKPPLNIRLHPNLFGCIISIGLAALMGLALFAAFKIIQFGNAHRWWEFIGKAIAGIATAILFVASAYYFLIWLLSQ